MQTHIWHPEVFCVGKDDRFYPCLLFSKSLMKNTIKDGQHLLHLLSLDLTVFFLINEEERGKEKDVF